MSTPTVYRFRVFRETAAGLVPVPDPESGFQMGRAGLDEDRARLATMADADQLAEGQPEERFVVLDSEGRECYVANPVAVPF